MTETLKDTSGLTMAVTTKGWEYSDTHFEATLLKGKLKGRTMLFLKSRPYTVVSVAA
ncbi:hypothetical protein LJR231_003494 [Phyllobacterium sp. LjRoot231]|uniref:hypothetical protein n=1 Tax=Phyllobacterium sp. LjRoot231 TaxID=3342289 RepID=UPI003ECC5F6C